MGQDASKGASLAPPVKACHPGAVRRLSRSPSVTSSTSSSAPVDVQLRVRSVSCVDQHNKQSQQDMKQRQVMALLDVIFKALDSNHDGFVDRYDVLQWVESEPHFKGQNAKQVTLHIFKRMDRNQGNKITVEDFKGAFKHFKLCEIKNMSVALAKQNSTAFQAVLGTEQTSLVRPSSSLRSAISRSSSRSSLSHMSVAPVPSSVSSSLVDEGRNPLSALTVEDEPCSPSEFRAALNAHRAGTSPSPGLMSTAPPRTPTPISLRLVEGAADHSTSSLSLSSRLGGGADTPPSMFGGDLSPSTTGGASPGRGGLETPVSSPSPRAESSPTPDNLHVLYPPSSHCISTPSASLCRAYSTPTSASHQQQHQAAEAAHVRATLSFLFQALSQNCLQSGGLTRADLLLWLNREKFFRAKEVEEPVAKLLHKVRACAEGVVIQEEEFQQLFADCPASLLHELMVSLFKKATRNPLTVPPPQLSCTSCV